MFTHLHVHTEYSVLDGFGKPSDFIKKAKSLGQKAIAITEHGNVDGIVEALESAKKEGIKLLCGCEFYIVKDVNDKNEDDNKNRHINIFAKNEEGWGEILKMLTYANLYGFYRKPRIDISCFFENYKNGNLIVTGACIGGFLGHGCDWGLDFAKDIIKMNKEDFYLEIMPHNFDKQRVHNKNTITFAKKNNIKIIATNDAHYANKEDARLHDICIAIRTKDTMSNPNRRFKFDGEDYFIASERQMFRMFKDYHTDIDTDLIVEALNNTQEIVDKCYDFYLEEREPDLPLAPLDGLTEQNVDDYFYKLIMKGFKEKIKDGFLCDSIEEYEKRIEEEFLLIKKKGFCKYFLTIIEVMKFCIKKDIAVGAGRGSAAGCLIAYLVGITQVDPLKHDLLFARFLNPFRMDYPDIDIDFCRNRRGEVIQHFKDVYGEDRVAQITTYLRMKSKMAINDVFRVFEVPQSEVLAVTKEFPKSLFEDGELEGLDESEEDFKIEEFFLTHENPVVREFYMKYKEYIYYASKLVGTLRGYGKHAAGVCISSSPLTDGKRGYLCKRKDMTCINWEKNTAESKFVQLIKMDILGLATLTQQSLTVKMIEENRGEKINLNKLSIEDPKALDLIKNGNCLGIFQLSSYGITKLCKQVGVSNFADLTACLALYRPGCLHSGMTEDYIQRANGKKYVALHPAVESLLAETKGIMVYQEQIMKLVYILAGFELAETEKLRKIIAKSKGDEINKYKTKFIDGCYATHNNWEENYYSPEQIWEMILTFSAYGFNKCLSGNTTVVDSENKSWKITEVPIGSKIKTLNGLCTVKDRIYNGKKELFRITLNNGKTIECTKNHKLLCEDKKTRTVEDIIKHGFNVITE